jgi:hypothetical protein
MGAETSLPSRWCGLRAGVRQRRHRGHRAMATSRAVRTRTWARPGGSATPTSTRSRTTALPRAGSSGRRRTGSWVDGCASTGSTPCPRTAHCGRTARWSVRSPTSGTRAGRSAPRPREDAVRRGLELTADGRPLFTSAQSTRNPLERSVASALGQAAARGVRVVVKAALGDGQPSVPGPVAGPGSTGLEQAARHHGVGLDAWPPRPPLPGRSRTPSSVVRSLSRS